MKITLLCPLCTRPLTDKFSAKSVCLTVGHDYNLSMECLNCGRMVDVVISIVIADVAIKGPPE